MSKGSCENKSALFIPFDLSLKKFTKFQPIIEVKQLKVGRKSHCEITVFSNECWPQLLAPLEILMSKISLKYIPIHI